MMAWGRMGWLDDVSMAFVAQLINFSKTFSMTLLNHMVNKNCQKVEARRGNGFSSGGWLTDDSSEQRR
jgi:hypothetical protein